MSEAEIPWLNQGQRPETRTGASATHVDEPAVAVPESRPAEPPKPEGPLDRLSAATLLAETNQDLEALKELKDSWKNAVRTTVGPGRARAKREYADCLWAIQILTGERGDQREALQAYREYVLHAPAGGTDSRTVQRMRSLEDALTH